MIKISTLRLTNVGTDFSGQVSAENLSLKNDEDVSYGDTVLYSLHASLVNNGVLITGSIETDLLCRCCRCLEEYGKKVVNKKICHFYKNPIKPEIDLTFELREDIIISFPQNFVCSEGCKGLCPVCGENRNRVSCNCDNGEPEENIWKALDTITGKKC